MITDLVPDKLLTSYISKYSFISLSRTYRPEQYVPDGAVKVFIYEGDEYIRYCSDTGRSLRWKDGAIGNLSPRFSMEIDRPIRLTICCFRASAFYQLFGIPIHLLHDDFIPLEEIIAKHTHQLKDSLAHTICPHEKKKLLDRFFIHLLSKRKLSDLKAIPFIEQIILCYRGNIQLDRLMRHTNMSPRTVERLFGEYIGMPPKQFCKIVRFNHAFLLRKYNPKISWQEIVYECGYYDQSHYINEFRSHMGVSPQKYGKGRSRMSSLYVGTHIDYLDL
ncbi:AraC family transcriptional regulator [Parapusillimonas sp. SGNA-6]|uniref:helix-turn-helix domain-containing protein n=1 Tax=Parapedobacter sp. SGR-10 TaxID=2710879 RepID=UPI0013D5A194|nr:AraC family transcriptional regulator [Parapedobacter sp. SGR-10]NGF55980.1 AraC family transcriptional regulator [Parapedobacter sp. SGR-10]NGM90197.1 AraC family transcriptional regulator [Parapusillimonas sp. SGNA-6]